MSGGVDLFTDPRTLSDTALRDLLKAGIEAYPFRGQWETLQAFQTYAGLRELFSNKIEEQGGTSVIFDVQGKSAGSASKVIPFEPIQPSIADTLARGRAEFRRYQTNWSVEQGEILTNMGESKIIDLVRTRRNIAIVDLMDLMSPDLWAVPSATDNRSMLGYQYTLVPITSGQTIGFNGTYAAGFSDCYGLSTTTYPRWKSLNARWDAAASFAGVVTDADVKTLSQLMLMGNFESPPMATDINATQYAKFKLYTNMTIRLGLEERARKNNDNLGNDVTRYAGGTLINNIPVLWERQLDDLAAGSGGNALFGINHSYFKPIARSGMWMMERGPINGGNTSPLTETTFTFAEFAHVCTNRQRAGFRIDPVAA